LKDAKLKKWPVSANNDFLAAGYLLNQPKDKVITNVVCYLSQQSAEKFLKAYLYFKDIYFTKTHTLEVLLNKCFNADSTFPDINVGRLTSYNISMRYPDEFRVPELNEATESYEINKSIRNIILSKISVQESDLSLF